MGDILLLQIHFRTPTTQLPQSLSVGLQSEANHIIAYRLLPRLWLLRRNHHVMYESNMGSQDTHVKFR